MNQHAAGLLHTPGHCVERAVNRIFEIGSGVSELICIGKKLNRNDR